MIAGAGYRDSVPHLVADPACAERDGAEPVLHCIVLYCTVQVLSLLLLTANFPFSAAEEISNLKLVKPCTVLYSQLP